MRPAPCRRSASGSPQLIRPGPRGGRKGHLCPRAGAGFQSLRPKVGPGPALPPAGGSRPRCRGRATKQGSVLGLRPRFPFSLGVDPHDRRDRGGSGGPRGLEAQRLGRGVEVGPERRPGRWRPALSALSSPSAARRACPPQPQPSPLSSPSPAPGSAFPPSALGRIQPEKAPLSFCVCWGRCGRRRDRVTTFIS